MSKIEYLIWQCDTPLHLTLRVHDRNVCQRALQ